MTSAVSAAPIGDRQRVRTVAAGAGTLDLLGALPREAPLAWVRGEQGFVGWGEVARLEVRGPDRFARAAAWWQELTAGFVVHDAVRAPGCGPVVFGSFGYDDDATSVLVVPEVVLGRRHQRAWVTTVGDAAPRLTRVDPPVAPEGVTYAQGSRTAPDWEAQVSAAVQRIADGALDKVVLARDLVATAQEPVDVRAVLRRLADRYPGCWTFSVDGMIGATPELLVRLERGLVTSRVLAGTIQRTGDDAKDLALAAGLARSSKDLEEHMYAVRSVADALVPHCTGMNVPESPFVLHLANVMHLASDVTGARADDSSALDLAAALHPSAAVCGTPTDAAAALIREIEGLDRGRYAGPVGWMDANGDGEWGLALRSAEVDRQDPRRLRLFAGCGIVAGSDPASELAESQAKFVPMRDALSD